MIFNFKRWSYDAWVSDPDISVGGELDFKLHIAGVYPGGLNRNVAPRTLYLIGNKYMNVNTAGNFVWSAAGGRYGIGAYKLRSLAQIGSLTGQLPNNIRFDESHEQRAIKLGYNYGYMPWGHYDRFGNLK